MAINRSHIMVIAMRLFVFLNAQYQKVGESVMNPQHEVTNNQLSSNECASEEQYQDRTFPATRCRPVPVVLGDDCDTAEHVSTLVTDALASAIKGIEMTVSAVTKLRLVLEALEECAHSGEGCSAQADDASGGHS
ncbi:hypothetical protein [Paraburkholderia sp. SIMBA_030]|uniref:hypothetical protein n=1 Tax=Paraburkholderia sp. SIMBA_030 TaxID=3085773 RepID=UPI00397A0012